MSPALPLARAAPGLRARALSIEQVNGAIKKYVDEYVLCKMCNLPDTKLIKDDRQTFIRCEVCGAKYPFK